jgi:cell division protein FtsQ
MITEHPDFGRRWRLVRGGGPPSGGRFVARSRRRRLRVLLPYLVVLLVVALVGGIGWLVYGTTVFAARTVRVEGARTVPAGEVERVAAISAALPLSQLDTQAISARVRGIPAIADVRVTRSWPSTVTLVVTERVGVAVVAQRGRFLVLDAEGVPFRTVAARPPKLPLIQVSAPGPADRATRAALSVVSSLTPQLRGKLVRITALTSEQVTLLLHGDRTIFWGDADDGVRKATVATALLDRPGSRIDVSAPDVVTVK